MEKTKKRSEIDNQYKWDLTKIYKSDKECLKDLEECRKSLSEIEKFRGKITKSAKDLLKYLHWNDEYDRKLTRVYEYIHLHFDEDTENTTYQNLSGKVDQLLQEFSEATAFIPEEMMKTDYSVIEKYIKEEPGLKTYAHNLENTYRYQKHVLTETEQSVVSTYENVISSSQDIFSALTNSDMEFGTIKDENGKEVELNSSNYSIFIRSKNRDVRRNAFQMLHNAYGNHKNTLAKIFATQVEAATQGAKLRKYSTSMESALFADNISPKVYNTIIDTVHNHLDVAYKYFKLKKDILGLKEFHNYDLYVDLIDEYDKKYTYEEAKDLVIKALSPLGEDYINHLNRAFNEKWIDVYHNKGKRSGAYSTGFYDTFPFILLNYEGTLNDVSTLAHELGHSMHSLYSWENNDYPNSSYRLFVAEVASTTNELFLSKYLLKNSKDKKEKLAVLNNLLELFKGTIIRQTMFAEFERNMHAARENKEVLTHEYLEEEYFKLNKLYFGKDVTLDDEIKYEWSRIPHFYYNFYVYKYVIGLSCACYIVENILSGKKNAKENYLKFLSSGGSMYPAEELKIAGIDITKKDVFESALNMFNETLDEFREYYEKDNKE